MKFAWALLTPLVCALAAAPSDLDRLIDAARSAPPEFAADSLIRLAGSDKLEKARKIQLLEEAFQRTASAQEMHKHRAAILRDGPAGFINRAYSLEVDATSLRAHAVEGLLPLDARKAKDLFLSAPLSSLPKLSCEDYLVPDVSRYYVVLGEVARRGFTAEEVAKQEPYRFIQNQVGMITSEVQVGPAARLLAAAALPDEEFQTSLTTLAGTLRTISGDDRSFTASIRSTQEDIQALVSAAAKRNVPVMALLDAYRAYLVSHLTAARCADNDQIDRAGTSFGISTQSSAGGSDPLTFFNMNLRMEPLKAISEQEATPKRLEGEAKGLKACESAECQAIAEQYRSLVFNGQGVPYSSGEKASAEWQSRLQEFLSAMVSWKPASESSASAHFRDKCGIYNDLLSPVPNGPTRDLVLRYTLDFLNQNRYQVEHRAEWLLPVSALIGRVQLDPIGLGKLGEELRRSGDPVISLYANLEAAAPRSPDRIVPLL